MQAWAATDTGAVREHNEDAYWFDGRIFLVCDGMGGHNAGEIAAATAVKTVQSFSLPLVQPLKEIEAAILAAQDRILALAAQNPEMQGMGTTLTMAAVHHLDGHAFQLFIGHVGDSRAYLLQNGNLVQLTEDHSVVAELCRNGRITVDEAASHPQRHMLTQALGHGEVSVATAVHQAYNGDRLLLCTDGVSGVLPEAKILQALTCDSPQKVVEELIEGARQLGSPDNTTAIVAFFPDKT